MGLSLALRAAAELEMRRRRAEVMAQLDSDEQAIPEDMTFRQWCDTLAKQGMKVDGKPFSLEDRPALIPLYEAIPTTRKEAAGKTLVLMKSTQIGASVWEFMAALYMSLKWEPVTIGMYMPSQASAIYKSENRFMRVVRSAAPLYKILTTGRDVSGNAKIVGEGNVLTRKVGESIMLFLWTTGKVTTESVPCDVVTLDECQEMTLDQIDKVQARTGDSEVAFTLLLSTANMPDLDIDHWYRRGNQEVWHTECQHCKAMSDLSDPAGIFPGKSIGYNGGDIEGVEPNEYYWRCPVCGGVIDDPQIGRYIVQNPGASKNIRSLLLPRTISPKLTPRKMFEGWMNAKTGDQKKSFYNRTLARPYIDANQLPVTLAHCLACVEEGLRAGVVWKTSARDTYMGIDQMGGFNAVIIKERLRDGRQAVIHVEAIFDLSPFDRCSELMAIYGVAMCVVEQLPNVNDARKFANRHKGRVFLAGYADLRDDAMSWGDDLSKSDRKTSEDDRTRYTVNLNQYKCMQTSLYRIRDRFCLFPNPDDLVQDVIDNGATKRIPLLRDWVFHHFTKTALVVEQDDETRKLRAKVLKVGIDPHYSYANMLCDVAWARNHGTGQVWFPDQKPKEQDVVAMVQNMPGMPADVAAKILEAPPASDVCGACRSFNPNTGYCEDRGFKTREKTPGCEVFVRRG